MRIAVTAAVAVLLLAGCGTTEGSTVEQRPAAATTAPVSVTDARTRTVRLEEPAGRVVALEWGLAENLVTLGVMPAGVADVKGFGTWVTAEKLAPSVKDVGTRGEPSVDSIVALEPDLVVATTDSAPALITQLEKYVPVVVLKGNDATASLPTLRRNLELLATATGTRDRATAVLAELDASMAGAKAKIAAAGRAGTEFTMADGWKEGSSVSIRMYAPGSLLSDVATGLGLKNAWTAKGDPAYGLAQTDVEGLTALGDVRFLYIASDADGGDVFADGLKDNAIWTSLPFVRNGHVHRLPDGIWMFGGPRSVQQFIDRATTAVTS